MPLPAQEMWTMYLAAALVVGCFLAFQRRFNGNLPVPGGPKGYPFIGNLLHLPRKDPFKTYYQWSTIYGPMVYMHILGREFVVLNSLKAITDLFEKRSSIYSTRPRLVMAGELVERAQTSVLFLKYGPRWKACRQTMHGWMNLRVIPQYYPLVESNANLLLSRIVESPGNFSGHIKANAGSLILKLAYGIEPKPENDPWVNMSEELSKITAIVSEPGRWLVDSFPFLRYMPRWMPGTDFLTYAESSKKVSKDILRLPYEHVTEKIAKGVAEPSWTLNYIQGDSGRPKTSEEISTLQSAAGSLYAGGIDTMASYLRTFFLNMARNPEVQKKAQAEIDAVIGSDRLANMADKPHLPYVGCIIKEVFRINAIVPLMPHSLDEDDIYDGYRIPKGAWVMANLWAVFNEPSTYSDPERFNPDRFEARPGHAPEMDPTTFSFGVGMGRRFCPGYNLAMAFIFINVTQILSTVTISPELDKDGNEIVPPLKFDAGHISAPSPFNCTIKPRSLESVRLVEHSIAAAGRDFKVLNLN